MEQTIKDIVNLNFNPGEAVPTYTSAQRGVSILTCCSKMAHEVETIKDNKEACRVTAHMAQFNEVRRRQKTPPSPPPDTYFELRLSVNTFCALVWTLVGDKCNYYKGPFFMEQTINDIVNLNFNLGEAVPTYASAQRGVSILTCCSKTAHEVETIRDNEEVRRVTAHTGQFNEVRRRQK
jgi:hypothetical protein